MSFRAWLKQHLADDSPLGDISRDILADRNFPRGALTEEKILNHLRTANASELAETAPSPPTPNTRHNRPPSRQRWT